MLQNKKNINLIFGHCCCFNHPIHLVSTIIEMQQHLNKVNNRIHVKITCRVFVPSLNNKTTVTYVMMQTTQKDSFFKNNWFINEIYEGMENGHFDSKSFWYELKQWNFTKSLITSKRVCIWTRKTFWVNINFSFFKSSMWNYLLEHT